MGTRASGASRAPRALCAQLIVTRQVRVTESRNILLEGWVQAYEEAVADVRRLLGAVVPRAKRAANHAQAVVLVEHRDGERAVLRAQAEVPEPPRGAARPLLAGVGPAEGVVRGVFDDEGDGGRGRQRPVLGVVVADVCVCCDKGASQWSRLL